MANGLKSSRSQWRDIIGDSFGNIHLEQDSGSRTTGKTNKFFGTVSRIGVLEERVVSSHLETKVNGMTEPSSQLSVVLDFDGTITLRDIGDFIVGAFAVEGWQIADTAFKRGELSLRELWGVSVNHLRQTDHDEICRSAVQEAVIRLGFTELVEFCRSNNIPVEVASSGIRFYIDAILEKAGAGDVPVSAPDIEYNKQGHGLITFKDGLRDCGMTAMCKCERVWQQRRQGRTVLFVGDGASDYCAASQADYIMARSALARNCLKENQPFTPFEDFFDVQSFITKLINSS